MAYHQLKTSSSILLTYKDGLNSKGEDLYKKQRLSKIKVTANDEDVYSVAAVIGGLLMKEVTEITREDKNKLIEA